MRLWQKCALSLLVGFMAVVVLGQETEASKLAHKQHLAASASQGPVMVSEMRETIGKIETAIAKVVLAKNQNSAAVIGTAKTAPVKTEPDRPAKRTEIVGEFWRLFQMSRPHFKFTPRASKFDPALLTVPAADPNRKPLETMIRFGCIGKVAPLATNPGPNIELAEYGDALGYFIARIGDLTHTPSAKWSPYMFGHKDG